MKDVKTTQKKNHKRTYAFHEYCKMLYCVGYSFESIYQLALVAFDTIEIGTITLKEIKGMYLANREEWENSKTSFIALLKEETSKTLKANFIVGTSVESKQVHSFGQKIEDLLLRFDRLDPIKDKEEYTATLAAIDALQKRIEVLSGSKLCREVTELSSKLQIQSLYAPAGDGKNNPLPPPPMPPRQVGDNFSPTWGEDNPKKKKRLKPKQTI